jgi:hypothetical protein
MNRPDKICLFFVVEGTVDETRGRFETEETKDVTISDRLEERFRYDVHWHVLTLCFRCSFCLCLKLVMM